MAEIKSTLDLILEKTNNMTITDEEKEEIRRTQLKGQIKGWIQQYRDRRIDLAAIRSEMEDAEPENRVTLIETLRKELLRHIDPEGDNTRVFALLQELCGVAVAPLAELIDAFHHEVDALNEATERNISTELAERGISGSAVVPNPSRDEQRNTLHEQLIGDFTEKLRLIADN